MINSNYNLYLSRRERREYVHAFTFRVDARNDVQLTDYKANRTFIYNSATLANHLVSIEKLRFPVPTIPSYSSHLCFISVTKKIQDLAHIGHIYFKGFD